MTPEYERMLAEVKARSEAVHNALREREIEAATRNLDAHWAVVEPVWSGRK